MLRPSTLRSRGIRWSSPLLLLALLAPQLSAQDAKFEVAWSYDTGG